MVISYFRLEVEIRPFRSCAMHPAIIIGTYVRSLWTLLSAEQIPLSTERISSFKTKTSFVQYCAPFIRRF